VKVFMDNDANIAALGESWYGNGIGIDNFVLYAAGMGIGAGVIIDGMLYRGEDDVVSEVGHITINTKGRSASAGISAVSSSTRKLRILSARRRESGETSRSKLRTSGSGTGYPRYSPRQTQGSPRHGRSSKNTGGSWG
jgi:predicted NBD/HSP70 family sugar kinase